ncbi:RNA polymerase sigma factor [candidate division KSB1 bacterium]
MKIREKTLLRRLHAGDREACTTLIDIHYKQVYWYLLDLSKDKESAADLTQSTFAKAWEAIPKFRGASSFRTWLFSIARNEFLLLIRKEKRYPEVVEYLELDIVPDDEQSVEEDYSSYNLEQFVREQVKTLPNKYREVISLYYYSGMRIREVAQFLAIPNGTVKSRIHQALLLLKEKVETEEIDYENIKVK